MLNCKYGCYSGFENKSYGYYSWLQNYSLKLFRVTKYAMDINQCQPWKLIIQ